MCCRYDVGRNVGRTEHVRAAARALGQPNLAVRERGSDPALAFPALTRIVQAQAQCLDDVRGLSRHSHLDDGPLNPCELLASLALDRGPELADLRDLRAVHLHQDALGVARRVPHMADRDLDCVAPLLDHQGRPAALG